MTHTLKLKPVFEYFRGCYQADNTRSVLDDVFHRSVEHRIFLEDEESIFSGVLPYAPVTHDRCRDAAKAAHIYRKEKDLVYGSFLMVGRQACDDGGNFICAPLLICPTGLRESQGVYFVEPDLGGVQLNYGMVENLPYLEGDRPLSDEIWDILCSGMVGHGETASLANLLEKRLPGMDCAPILEYPNLWDETAVRKLIRSLRRRKESTLLLVPASFMGLIGKSREARGILNELAEVAALEQQAGPLRFLLDRHHPTVSQPVKTRLYTSHVPAILSDAQMNILKQASSNPVTLVIGPPGTGKSFTIASLAVEHMARDQTVLIVSKMDHAVDVVAGKIEEMLVMKNCTVRGGQRHYLKDLKKYLEILLSGMGSGKSSDAKDVSGLETELKKLDRKISKLEKRIEVLAGKEINWSRDLASNKTGFLKNLKKKYSLWKAHKEDPLWELFDALEEALQERMTKARTFIKTANSNRIERALMENRTHFKTFLRGLRARTGGKQEELFKEVDFRVILKAMPIWLVKLSDIHEVLPLYHELFDLVIIDEATQCDIASCLPTLQRGKRLVVCGDPNQLRHISFLSIKKQRDLAEEYNLARHLTDRYNYRKNSMLDLVNDVIDNQDQVLFLDEHYRSEPAIIHFSNQHFYNQSLRVMTEKPHTVHEPALVLKKCGGSRSETGENAVEATSVMDSVLKQIKASAHLPNHLVPGLGVLSPFRAQADYLSQLISQQLSAEQIHRHRILVGTAHAFQGEERDVMLLSPGIDANYHSASLRFLENPGVFNVSITRARTYQELHLSLDEGSLPVDSLLRLYIQHIKNHSVATPLEADSAASYQNLFLNDVAQACRSIHLEVICECPLAGYIMDLVVMGRGTSLAIDLVGYPGQYEDFIPIDRYRMFGRTGMKIFALPYSKWVLDRKGCLKALSAAL